MEPRPFFIEDRLESYRKEAVYNFGESGLSAFRLEEILSMAALSSEELLSLPMCDSPNRGSEELRIEIANLYPEVKPEEVLITTGTSEALYIAFALLIQKGSPVDLLWPAFQALYEIPALFGAKINRIPWELGLEPKTWEQNDSLAIINQPHNPTGKTFTSGAWNDLLSVLSQKGKVSLFDEHYRFLPEGSGLGPTGASPKNKRYGTGSFTKCFGATGLRLGWLIADTEFIDRARSFKDYLTHTVSPISERIALGLLKNRDSFLPAIQNQVRQNRELFASVASSLPGVSSHTDAKAGLVTWVKLQNGIPSEVYADDLYKNTGIFVLPGANFESEGYLRVGFGETVSKFAEGLERWKYFQPTI